MDDDVPVEDPWGGNSTALFPLSKTPVPLPRSLDDATGLPSSTGRRTSAEDPLVRAVLEDSSLSQDEKEIQLQSMFSRAASNGDIRCVKAILLDGRAHKFIDIDAED